MQYKYFDFYNVQVNLCPKAWDTVEWDGKEWTIEKIDYDDYTVPTAILTKPAAWPAFKVYQAVAISELLFVCGNRTIDYKAVGSSVKTSDLRFTP